jgi:hypothetical protein
MIYCRPFFAFFVHSPHLSSIPNMFLCQTLHRARLYLGFGAAAAIICVILADARSEWVGGFSEFPSPLSDRHCYRDENE